MNCVKCFYSLSKYVNFCLCIMLNGPVIFMLSYIYMVKIPSFIYFIITAPPDVCFYNMCACVQPHCLN